MTNHYKLSLLEVSQFYQPGLWYQTRLLRQTLLLLERMKKAQAICTIYVKNMLFIVTLFRESSLIRSLFMCSRAEERFGWWAYLLTVKPVYNGPVYSRSPCILRSPENFPKFSVALYLLQIWPVYSGYPVYNGHLTILQGWPISRAMSPPPFPQLHVRFFFPRIVWITLTSG